MSFSFLKGFTRNFAFFVLSLTVIASAINAQEKPADGKRNARPESKPATRPLVAADSGIIYSYEFNQPDFVINRIKIQHNDDGVGTITFEKRMSDEPITDPLLVSPATMEHIRKAYSESRFLDTTEDYQDTKHSFPNLGTTTLELRDGIKVKTASFNWTQNKQIDEVAKDYRRLSNQYVWMFDVNLARQNQPLDAPKIVERLDSLLRRNEIADPPQMLPFLDDMVNDERLPLLARNHTAKLAAQIRKKHKVK